MEIILDNNETIVISEDMLTILAHRFPPETLSLEISMLLIGSLNSLIEGVRNDIIAENIIAIKANNPMIPSDDNALAKLIIEQPDYKDAAARKPTLTPKEAEENETIPN